ncbi:MAG: type II toxin-antitoxin system VapB family antitoxin [Oscillatoria sp. SIO1A7]|nr:type II toxin-antitoxin system VapB family antitoxin [Oscillatoria sp. SIO1A7]
MIITIEIDDKLLEKAIAMSDRGTLNTSIEEALREYIQRRQQLKVLDLFGTIDYEEDYDYKQQRQRP